MRLAAEISRDYQDREPTLLGVLKGSVIFLADLARALTIPARVAFVEFNSYQGTQRTEAFNTPTHHLPEVAGQDLILVEDIIDTGRTAASLTELLEKHHPNSIKLCALLQKPARRETTIIPDYVGFTIPDVFVVGYGLDLDQKYRNLPDIHILNSRDNTCPEISP